MTDADIAALNAETDALNADTAAKLREARETMERAGRLYRLTIKINVASVIISAIAITVALVKLLTR